MTKKKIPARKEMKFPMPRAPHQRTRVFSKNEKPSLTEQSHAAGCDLKLIMDRYTKTGQIPLGNTRGTPEFMDCPDNEYDFKHVQDTLAAYRSQYELLPDQVKSQFQDAQDFMSYLMAQEQTEEDQDLPGDNEGAQSATEGAEGPSEASKTANGKDSPDADAITTT